MIEAALPAKSVAPARASASGTSRPLYVELADSLQNLVEQGTLRPGHRVPSVRIMSRQRDVSIATVLQAYTVLENRGYLEARAHLIEAEGGDPQALLARATDAPEGASTLRSFVRHVVSR